MKCPRNKNCFCQYGRYAILPLMKNPLENVDTSCPYIQFKSTNVGDFYVCKLGDTFVPGGPVNSRW